MGIGNHTEEVFPRIDAGAGNAFVSIFFYVYPVGIFLNKVGIVLNLIFKAPLLPRLFSENTGVNGDTEGQIENRYTFPHLFTQLSNCHHGY